MMPDDLDALIQAMERVQQLEAEVEKLRLTEAEREAIAWFSIYSDTPGEERHAVVLERLIARCRVDCDR
jgi:chlorite dismutase